MRVMQTCPGATPKTLTAAQRPYARSVARKQNILLKNGFPPLACAKSKEQGARSKEQRGTYSLLGRHAKTNSCHR